MVVLMVTRHDRHVATAARYAEVTDHKDWQLVRVEPLRPGTHRYTWKRPDGAERVFIGLNGSNDHLTKLVSLRKDIAELMEMVNGRRS